MRFRCVLFIVPANTSSWQHCSRISGLDGTNLTSRSQRSHLGASPSWVGQWEDGGSRRYPLRRKYLQYPVQHERLMTSQRARQDVLLFFDTWRSSSLNDCITSTRSVQLWVSKFTTGSSSTLKDHGAFRWQEGKCSCVMWVSEVFKPTESSTENKYIHNWWIWISSPTELKMNFSQIKVYLNFLEKLNLKLFTSWYFISLSYFLECVIATAGGSSHAQTKEPSRKWGCGLFSFFILQMMLRFQKTFSAAFFIDLWLLRSWFFWNYLNSSLRNVIVVKTVHHQHRRWCFNVSFLTGMLKTPWKLIKIHFFSTCSAKICSVRTNCS